MIIEFKPKKHEEELKEAFIAWFADGGGEDGFYETLSDRTEFIDLDFVYKDDKIIMNFVK